METIELENVPIVTPNGDVLVEALTFSVPARLATCMSKHIFTNMSATPRLVCIAWCASNIRILICIANCTHGTYACRCACARSVDLNEGFLTDAWRMPSAYLCMRVSWHVCSQVHSHVYKQYAGSAGAALPCDWAKWLRQEVPLSLMHMSMNMPLHTFLASLCAHVGTHV